MLSQNEMVINMVRTAVESLYTGSMSITNKQEITNHDTHITDFKDVTVCENEPCRVSYKNTSTVAEQDGASKTAQEIKLFCSPSIIVSEGSKIIITQNGVTRTYERSGTPAVYSSHQEVILTLCEEWT